MEDNKEELDNDIEENIDLDDEKVEAIRFSLSSFLFFIALIIIIIMGIFLYKSNNDKKKIEDLTEEVGILRNSIFELKNNDTIVSEEKDKTNSKTKNQQNSEKAFVDLDDVKIPENLNNDYNELNDEKKSFLYITEAEKNEDNTYTLYGVAYSKYTLTEEQYQEILEIKRVRIYETYYDVLYNDDIEEYTLVPHIQKSGDISFVIKEDDEGEHYIEKNSDDKESSNLNVWKITNDFYKVTVASNVTCEEEITEDKTTAEQEFQNYSSSNPTNPISPLYGRCFKFEQKNGKVVSIKKVILGL